MLDRDWPIRFPEARASRALVVLAALSWLGALALEWLTPLGAVHGAVHLLPLLLAGASGDPRAVVVLAGASVAVIVAGQWMTPAEGRPSWEAAHRGLSALLVVVVAAALLVLRMAVRQATRGRREARRATAALARTESEQRGLWRRLHLLDSAVSMLDEIILITDAAPLDAPEGPRIVYVNNAFERITGYTVEETIGQTPRMLQGPRTQRDELDRLRAALEAEDSVSVELINYTAEGREYWLEMTISPVFDARGKATHFVAVERDVTQRKLNELALREAEERHRLITRATHDVVWDWDIQSGRVWCSDSADDVFGRRIDHVDQWIDLVHPEDRPRAEALFGRLLSRGVDVADEEYRIRRADGGYIRVVDRAFVLRDADGQPIRMLGTMRDVTEARQLEEQLRRAQTLEAIGTLTGGFAHDVNNLMAVVLGNADLLDEALEDDPGSRALVAQIAGAADRAAALTGRLLAFAREQPLEPRAVDVARLIHRLGPILRSSLPGTVDLRVQAAADLVPARVDAAQLEVAVLNLVVNARDAMPGGGSITVEISVERSGELDDPLDGTPLPRECVVIAVRDTGTGMSPEVLDKATAPFFTTKPQGAGTGLGLSMVHGFARQSGGSLELSSTPGQGTVVRIILPASDAPAEEASAQDGDEPLKRGKGEHILLVEDDAELRWATERQLVALGYAVTPAPDAAEALTLLRRHRDVALLFTDLVLPGGMNGRELAERARQETPGLAVIYASGYAEEQVLAHDRPAPRVPLLRKPFRREQLASAVHRALTR